MRPVFGLQVEEETVPYPTLIPVVKRPQKVAIDLVDALREIKVCTSSALFELTIQCCCCDPIWGL
jgi:hypothetical protein